MFFPHPVPKDAQAKLSSSAMEFEVSGTVLRGWLIPEAKKTKGPCRLLIYFGGNSEEVSATALSQQKYLDMAQLYINYRGYGASDGKPSLSSIRSDALAVFEAALKRLKLRADEVCIIGRSLGSHPAALVASHNPVARLVLITPFDSILSMARDRFFVFPVGLMLAHPFDTLAEAADIRAPTLFVLAGEDPVVPHRYSHRLIDHWPGPHRVLTVPGTDHNSVALAGTYRQAVRAFLRDD